MNTIATGAHLAINILSTLLLAASNYAVQCLSAPTRRQLDVEHAKGRWLDIGVSSYRNFRASPGWHKAIILFFFVSSIPLHLVYNSIIIATPTVNEFMALLVAKEFITGATWQDLDTGRMYNGYEPLNLGTVQYLQDHIDDLVQLTNEECNQTYSKQLMTEWSNVLLISDVSQLNHTVIEGWEFKGNPSSWHGQVDWEWDGDLYKALQVDGEGIKTPGTWGTIEPTCNGTAGKDFLLNCHGTSGTLQANITYCLAQPVQPKCSISIATSSLAVVLICNAIKIACFLATLSISKFQPILTLGDAINSFLQHPDTIEIGTGPLSIKDIQKWSTSRPGRTEDPTNHPLESETWKQPRHIWFNGASACRWITTLVLLIVTWALCLALLISTGVGGSGFGTLNLQSLITGTTGRSLTANILLANFPQLILSFLYLFYNGVMTAMLVSAEFCRFARHKKGLRVSSEPRGEQRSTYWLQLPLRFAVPFMAMLAVLHWLVSRSIFAVGLTMYGNDGKRAPADDISARGYSRDGLLGSLICGTVLILVLPLLGCLKLTPGAPVVRSCSLAIHAAACSGVTEDATQKLMYGVLQGGRLETPEGSARRRVGFGTDVDSLVGERYD